MIRRIVLLVLLAVLFAGCCTLTDFDKCRLGIYQENHEDMWKHEFLEWDT